MGIFCGIVIEANSSNYINVLKTVSSRLPGCRMPIFQKSQIDSFPEEYKLLKAKRPITLKQSAVNRGTRIDESCQIIRVGGCLRRADPHHTVTKLLNKGL